ncbi:MAG TPA: hypothetical protein VFG23_08370 [Polyangia bacterium]|nr:hypothetical protein [Polyangia bacterium]
MSLCTIIARATDATGEQSVQVKLGKCSVWPTNGKLLEIQEAVAGLYRESFDPPEEAVHLGAVVLPYSEEHDA